MDKGMIKSIELSNFQSHKKTRLELHKGVNVIVGLSDSGKSAIMRGINWVVTNRPTGDDFRSNWGGDTDVTIVTAEGDEVSRVKTKTDNAYFLYNEATGVDEAYRGIGKSDIPDDVLNALNIEEVNIQSQMDPPFLLSMGSGEVARTLNKIANLEIIDTSISNIRKRVQSVTRDIETARVQIADTEAMKETFKFIPQMEKDVAAYESLQERQKSVQNQISALKKLITSIQKDTVQLESTETFLEVESEYKKAQTIQERLEHVQLEASDLKAYIFTIKKLHKDREDIAGLLEAEFIVEHALKLEQRRKDNAARITGLKIVIQQIKKSTAGLTRTSTEIRNKEHELKKLTPNKCPLCNK